MTTLRMEFYLAGAVFRWRWANERDYQAAKAFLENLLGYPAMKSGDIDFFYFEDRSQYDALVAFREKLERETRSA
jgi:hypothetical protein